MQISDKYIAFNSLFDRYYAGLCVYSESFVGSKPVAEDLVQDVFVNVWMKRDELNFDEGIINSYLYKAVHNACIQFLRHQRVKNSYAARIKLTEAECIPAEWVTINADPDEESEIQMLYQQALNQLPAQTRHIFLCSREQGMKYSEIAELIDFSVKTVEYHISKALEVFRKVLKDYI